MAPALTAAHLGTALIVILALCLGGADAVSPEGPDIPFGSGMFWIYVGICAVLTVFGGMCSGLSMGLLSQESLHLEVLSKSDDPTVAKHATAIQRLVKRRHLVLVTLLLANSAAMEALPLFLDRLTLAYIAIIISVTVVLMFGEILPSAICSKWGLAISYHMRYVVWAMIFVCLPIAWPISKALDLMLGADHSTYYRRSELKHFVVAHAQPEAEAETHAGLTQEETQIISGAIDLRDKTVKDCLQPLDKVFCIDINRVLDLPTLSELVKVGHSRVPVYDGERDNIVGLLRVKHLIIINPSVPTTVRQQQLYPIPRVNADRALYDMLQYFRTGRSHMVLVEERPSGKVLGIVTLEDLIEELLQAEIKGEEEVLFFRSQSNLMRSQSLRTVRSHPKSGDPRSLQRDTGRSFVVPRQQRDESRGRTRVDDVIIPINSEGSERTPLLSQSVPPSPATSAPQPFASVGALRAQKTVSFIA